MTSCYDLTDGDSTIPTWKALRPGDIVMSDISGPWQRSMVVICLEKHKGKSWFVYVVRDDTYRFLEGTVLSFGRDPLWHPYNLSTSKIGL